MHFIWRILLRIFQYLPIMFRIARAYFIPSSLSVHWGSRHANNTVPAERRIINKTVLPTTLEIKIHAYSKKAMFFIPKKCTINFFFYISSFLLTSPDVVFRTRNIDTVVHSYPREEDWNAGAYTFLMRKNAFQRTPLPYTTPYPASYPASGWNGKSIRTHIDSVCVLKLIT
jgi:hypothetical protein